MEKNVAEILKIIRRKDFIKSNNENLNTPVKANLIKDLPLDNLENFLELEQKLFEKKNRQLLVRNLEVPNLWRRQEDHKI